MITTNRKIDNEQERINGFQRSQARSFDIPNNQEDATKRTFGARESRTSVATESRLDRGNNSTIEPFFYTSTARRERNINGMDRGYSGAVVEVERPTRTSRKENEDIMPSIKTRAYIEQDKVTRKDQEKIRLNGKTKLALFCYIFAVIILASIVVATGISIAGATGQVAKLENVYAAQNAVLTNQYNEIKLSENETMLAGQATENGMVKNNNTKNLELISYESVVGFESKTNWFDQLCDWLSKIIGG